MGVDRVAADLGRCRLGACQNKWVQTGARWVQAGCLLGQGALGIQKEGSVPSSRCWCSCLAASGRFRTVSEVFLGEAPRQMSRRCSTSRVMGEVGS